MDWFAIKRARALILLDFDFNISFRAGKLVWTFEKRVPGLKTGVENDILWSEIGSGFGEPGGTWAAHHHQEYPPPRIPPPPPLPDTFLGNELDYPAERDFSGG